MLLRAPVRRSALEMGRVVTEALRALPTHAIVWIDEADRLPIDTLTEIRTLAEFDSARRENLIPSAPRKMGAGAI